MLAPLFGGGFGEAADRDAFWGRDEMKEGADPREKVFWLDGFGKGDPDAVSPSAVGFEEEGEVHLLKGLCEAKRVRESDLGSFFESFGIMAVG